MRSTFLIVAGALMATPAAAAKEILVLGDNWASFRFSKDLIEQYCVGYEVVNNAVVGSTAAQWASGQTGEIPAKNFTKVWVSLGGNDILFGAHSGCLRPPLAADLQTVFTKIRSANPDAEILATNYGWPIAVIPPNFVCPNFEFNTITDDIEAAVEAVNDSSVVFLDVQWAFGAKPSVDSEQPLSDPSLYHDWSHLNDDGYAVLFQLPAWMSFFCPDVPQKAAPSTTADTEGSDGTREGVSSTVGLQAWVPLAALTAAMART